MMPNMNFSNAMSSYTAQNIGAGKDKRVVQGYKACLLMVLIFSLIITGIIYLFGPQLLSLFLNSGSEGSAMGYGLRYMKPFTRCRRYGRLYVTLHVQPVFQSCHCIPAGPFHRFQRNLVVYSHWLGNRRHLLLYPRTERKMETEKTGGLIL